MSRESRCLIQLRGDEKIHEICLHWEKGESFITNSIKKKKVDRNQEEKLSSYYEIVRLLDYDVLLFKWKLINSRGINFVNIRQD